jgi:hypothetical protein
VLPLWKRRIWTRSQTCVTIEIAQAVTDCHGLLPDNQPRTTTAPTDEASTPGVDQSGSVAPTPS